MNEAQERQAKIVSYLSPVNIVSLDDSELLESIKELTAQLSPKAKQLLAIDLLNQVTRESL